MELTAIVLAVKDSLISGCVGMSVADGLTVLEVLEAFVKIGDVVGNNGCVVDVSVLGFVPGPGVVTANMTGIFSLRMCPDK